MNLIVEINTTDQSVFLSIPVVDEPQADQLLASLTAISGLTVLESHYSEAGPKGSELLVHARLTHESGVIGALMAYQVPALV